MASGFFHCLPYDIYLDIFNNLDRTSLYNLSLVSPLFNEVATPLLYKDMVLPWLDISYINSCNDGNGRNEKSVFLAFQRQLALRNHVRQVALYSVKEINTICHRSINDTV